MFDVLFFFFKQKTAYEMRISDWSSDVCSSDLARRHVVGAAGYVGFVTTGDLALGGRGFRILLVGVAALVDGLDALATLVVLTHQLLLAYLWPCSARPGGSIDWEAPWRRKLQRNGAFLDRWQLGRAHVCNPVTNAQLVSRIRL